ncbi:MULTISPECIES: lipopolysaccharide biosynthesis protein [Asticcacaulis]|uniref:lipopolysaccharide biosynthesis protein n=1 Tax=Asticcacaulis TaxID=76890 RepID=UPI001AE7FBC4|nr:MULTISPECIES: lipopolysaccharide biosynthesis protein [Asticcacaulis]MBP2159788.1 PST family polysaccharide transporter [Asticcacaulis solisilvae]MDR6800833.1 PST family polysaccharide transporter [Asticcacaulis sp. BE141]
MSQTRSKLLSGSLWMMLGTVANNIIGFVVFAALARVLAPAEIGAVLIAVIFIDIGRVLAFGGIPESLIQRAEWEDRTASTCFWLNIALAAIITVLVLIISKFVITAHFDASVSTALMALSSMFIIDAARAVHVSYLRRNFKYNQLALRGLWANTAAGALAVYMAFHGFGIWALVFQRIVQAVITTVVTWIEARWMPKFHFDWKVVRDVSGFSVNVTGSRLIELSITKLPDMVISAILGSAQLAFFRIGSRCLDLATQVLVQPIQDVSLSAFARRKDTSAAPGKGYLAVMAVTTTFVFPVFLGAAALAPDLITLFFGDKWAISATIMAILSLSVVPLVVTRMSSSALIAAGLSRPLVVIQILNLIFGLAALWYGTRFGIVWAAAAAVIAAYLTLPYVVWKTTSVLDITLRDWFGHLLPPLLAAGTMLVTLSALHFWLLGGWNIYVRVAAMALTGAAVYAASLILFGQAFLLRLHKEIGPVVPRKVAPLYTRLMTLIVPRIKTYV